MAKFERNPWPKKVVWLQDDITHPRFYWLAVDQQKAGQRIEASIDEQTILLSIQEGEPTATLTLLLNDALLDLDQPIKVIQDEKTLFEGKVERTIRATALTLAQRADLPSAASARLELKRAPER